MINGKIIGIAGYSGSGKSTLAKIVAERHNYQLIDVDALAKEIMSESINIRQDLQKAFGADVFHKGRINFCYLGEKAFKNRNSILTLNSIVHPILIDELKKHIDNGSKDGIIIDAALISYWKIEEWFDFLIWVRLSREKRLNRIENRVKDIQREELEKRFIIQESLFSEPSGKWNTIENSSDIEDLYIKFLDLKEK